MSWTGKRERGSLLLLRLTFWFVRAAGWRAGQALLAPVTLYFLVTSPRLRAVSRDYLTRVLNRPVRQADVARHVFTFACVLLDRVFFLGGRTEDFTLESEGVEALSAILAEGKGCVLLGAHLGSFDMLRAFGKYSPVPVNPVMFRQAGGVFSRLVEAIDPEMGRRIIDIGRPAAMLDVDAAIQRGEIVGFLGDRAPGPERNILLPFLGAPASFPTGPMVLASLVKAPVVLFYGVRTGPRHYKVIFEPFADRLALRRSCRAEDIRFWMECYVDSLARVCGAYPFNWFNFYDFWEEGRSSFLKKRSKKLLRVGAELARVPTPSFQKFFASFFQKRSAFLLLLLLPTSLHAKETPAAIMARLAALPDRTAGFTQEKHVASLAAPVKSSGRLVFRHPSHVEQITEAPRPERLVIDSGVLSIAEGGGAVRVVPLDAHPGLQALATTIAATLAGDLGALQRLYTVAAQGSDASWRMILTPRLPAVSQFISTVVLDGRQNDLNRLYLAQTNGDTQTMDIRPER